MTTVDLMHLFQVLGPIRLGSDDGPRQVEGPKIRRLLATLLLDPGVTVPADSLCDVLWREEVPTKAASTLRTYVTRLRRLLEDAGFEPELLRSEGGGYVLESGGDDIDALCFEGKVKEASRQPDPMRRATLLERSLLMWRGRAYGDLADEEPFRLEALRLEELHSAATEEWFEARLEAGDRTSLVAELESFVGRNPFRERPWGLLMRTLQLGGRQADALAAYDRFRRMLGEELGLEPSAALRALEDRILTEAPSETQSDTDVDAAVRIPPPAELDSFVGREGAMKEVTNALAATRLLTVTGVGGVGKTRLARRVAASASPVDGTSWCDLAEVSSPSELLPAITEAVGAPTPPGSALEESLGSHLHRKETLIVLDNCEHLLESLGEVLPTLLSGSHVKVLATSRAPLRAHGEAIYELAPLAVDSDDGHGSPSVRLFLDRTRVMGRPFSDQDPAIASLCRRLDGLPLAIELAAARCRSLEPAEILDRLDQRFTLLTDGARTAPERHRSLHATIDWSFDLLSSTERDLMARLSVFPGAFTLEAAEGVCEGGGIGRDEIATLLAGLVDHSLVAVDRTQNVRRYRLLETVRAYATTRLGESAGRHDLDEAYTRFYTEKAQAADRGLRGPEEGAWVQQVQADMANYRHVFRRAWEHHDTATALSLSLSLSFFARWRLQKEPLEWSELAVQLPNAEDLPLYPEAAGAAAWSLALRGERVRAIEMAEAGLAASGPSPSNGALLPLEALTHVALWEGRLTDCRRYREQGDQFADPDLTFVLTEVDCLASIYGGKGNEALTLVDELHHVAGRNGGLTYQSLAHYVEGEALREKGDKGAAEAFDLAWRYAVEADNRLVMGVASASRCSQLVAEGQLDAALGSFIEVIDTLWKAADWSHLWTALRSLVDLLIQLDRPGLAGQVLGAVLHRKTASPAFGADAERLHALESHLQENLGHGRLRSLQQEVAGLGDDEFVARLRRLLSGLERDR